MKRLIAITGGIGSGKSVVSQLLRTMGYTVYDCDMQAKRLMTADPLLRQQLTDLFGPDTYLQDETGVPRLNRSYLSSQIFANAGLLAQMNACVHPTVARDLLALAAAMPEESVLFFESAILYESGFDQQVPPTEVWTVSAPLELRIARAMRRDQAPRDKVLSRIQSQMPQEEKERRANHVIVNDDHQSVIQQVAELCYHFLNASKSST